MLLFFLILPFLSISQYSNIYYKDLQGVVLGTSISSNANYICYQQQLDPISIVVMKKSAAHDKYDRIAQFASNTSEQMACNDRLGISINGTYIGHINENETSITIFKFNQERQNYQYFNKVNSTKANKSWIYDISFNPVLEEEFAILTNGYVEIRRVDGFQVQVLMGGDEHGCYSLSGKYYLTSNKTTAILYERKNEKYEQFETFDIESKITSLGISGDENYIIISQHKTAIYKYHQEHGSFYVFSIIEESYDFVEVGQTGQILLLFDNENIEVHRLLNDRYTLTQKIPHSSLILSLQTNAKNDFTLFSYFTLQLYDYCSALYCATCPYSTSTCSTCIQRYYLLTSGVCISCQGLSEYCKSCSSSDYCDTCERDYTPSKGVCVKCLVNHCALCEQINRCSKCEQGFDYSNNKCVQDEEDDDTWKIILISVLVGVLGGGLILFLVLFCRSQYMKRKKGSKKLSMLQIDASKSDNENV